MTNNNQYKSVFLSDIHLGFNGCQNKKLENFLTNTDFENLYLVGDIIDFWSMEDKFYWPNDHQKILNIFVHLHGLLLAAHKIFNPRQELGIKIS